MSARAELLARLDDLGFPSMAAFLRDTCTARDLLDARRDLIRCRQQDCSPDFAPYREASDILTRLGAL